MLKIFLKLFLIFYFIIVTKCKTSCIYYNEYTNQEYDLNPIISNTSYSKQFNGIIPLSTYTMYLNFCNVTVSQCNGRVCQGSDLAGSLSVPENVEYFNSSTTKVMTIQYKTVLLGSGDCLAADPQRYRFTYINMNCNPYIDFQIDSISESYVCKYYVQATTKYVCRTCPFDCSGHGNCGAYDGKCICDLKTEGLGCEISKLFISSSDSAYETTGDTINIYGYFGNFTTSQVKVLIGNQSCINPVVNSDYTSLKCFIGPGSGVHNITFIDGDLSAIGINAFRYRPREYQCLNNCSNQGKCDTSIGVCECFKDYYGPDCKSTQSNSTTGVNGNDGSSNISNDNTNFFINIYSLIEYKIDGSIEKEHLLYNNWKLTSTINNTNSILTTFNQNLTIDNDDDDDNSNISVIQYTIEQILNETKSYIFATQHFSVQPNSLKVTVSIKSYKYQSSLNYLQLRILSSTDSNSSIPDDCRGTEFDVDGINNLQYSNYITIKKQNKVFYGRFLPLMLSDNRATFSSTEVVSKNSTSILIGLSMSHCTQLCEIDPDFSLLVSTERYSCGGERKWFLPVVIIAPVIGATLIVIISSVIYKRYRTSLKIAAAALKPAKLQNMS